MSQRLMPTSSISEIEDNIKKGKDKIIQVYEMLPNFCLPNEIPELLDDLKETMKSYVIVDSKYKDLKTSKQKVLQDCMERAGASNKEQTSITLDEISELLKGTLNNEKEKREGEFWTRDALYCSMKNFNDEGTTDQDQEMNDEEDLAVTGVSVQTIDPYSKKEFSDPVKNVRCNHSYEKAIIYQLMATNSKVRCYWMGCNNRLPIKSDDLVPDDDLRRHMTRLKARAAI